MHRREVVELSHLAIQRLVYPQLFHANPTGQYLILREHDSDSFQGIYVLYLPRAIQERQYPMHPALEPTEQLVYAKSAR